MVCVGRCGGGRCVWRPQCEEERRTVRGCAREGGAAHREGLCQGRGVRRTVEVAREEQRLRARVDGHDRHVARIGKLDTVCLRRLGCCVRSHGVA
eukprot:3044100-Prymnesium_polylepis.1